MAIFGVGGLGHLALQYAKIAGGFTIGVDIEDSKLAMATELGADHVVNARTEDPVEAIQRLGGADVAVALGGVPCILRPGLPIAAAGWATGLRRAARRDNATMKLPIFDTVLNGKTVIGSIVGTRNDLADVFALHAAGRTRVISVDRKLDDVNQAMTDVLTGQVPARIVFQFCTAATARSTADGCHLGFAATCRTRRPRRPAPTGCATHFGQRCPGFRRRCR